jgi:nucleoside transporter
MNDSGFKKNYTFAAEMQFLQNINWRFLRKETIPFCVMLFLQYMLVPVWWLPYAAYLTNAGVGANRKAMALSAMAVGFMASSIMGAFADRYFSAQKVLAISNFTVATLLAFAGFTNNTNVVIALVFIIMLLYMPTWALTGSIVLKHVQQEQFPRVRLFGTLGWVASGIFSLIFVTVFKIKAFDGSSFTFLCGSGVALVAALFNLTLPDTPPNGKKERFSIINILGFKAFTLFRDRNFLVFFLCTFTAVLGYALYYTYAAMFFYDRHFQYITVTMNWGQVGELFFLFITTLAIMKLGFKKAMIIGLGAMVLRYASFWWGSVTDTPAFYIIGVLFHGVIFGLFFVTGQIYVDKKAPEHLRAQAQGLMAFLVWGVALFIGNYLCNELIVANTTNNNTENAVYNWPGIFGTVTVFSALVWILFVVFYKDEKG